MISNVTIVDAQALSRLLIDLKYVREGLRKDADLVEPMPTFGKAFAHSLRKKADTIAQDVGALTREICDD